MSRLPGMALIVAALTLAPQAKAEDQSCITIEAPLDRLACYDKQSGRTPEETVTTSPATKWVVKTDVSKLSDRKQVYLHLLAKDTVSCSWNRQSQVYLTLRCQENATSAILSSDCHMVSSPYNDYGKVDFRVDDHPAKAARMNESTDNKALGLWTGAKAVPFIKQLLGGHNLIVQFTPFSDSPVTAEFDISGLDSVIGPLRTECKW